MLTDVQKANSQARVKILSDETTWIAFDHHFQSCWQTKELRQKLALADVHLPLVGEWAMWSFHELAREEATWKRQRGKSFKRAQRRTIEACEENFACYGSYTGLSPFDPRLNQVNEVFGSYIEADGILLRRAQRLLEKAENSAIFNGRRLGANWNCLYLELLKAYISLKTGWNETTTMTSIFRLVLMAHRVLGRKCSGQLRPLLQKALRHFEENPDNATLITLARGLVRDHEELYKQFPRVRLRPATA
jgi:hypothetical protein